MKRITFRRIIRIALLSLAAIYAFLVLSLVVLRFADPPFTAVHVQRRVESWSAKGEYKKRYEPVPLARISPNLQHAVIAAEDGRFYTHWGFDWSQIKDAIEDDLEDGRLRGASTITQQLVKNLFFTTRFGIVRKAAEAAVVPAAELILGKQRILELYLNTAEWGPGVFGIEAAANFHYRSTAARLSREQSARLAAILPSPRRRKPARMDRYSGIILTRMNQMGW
jgi:monofunctional biosynthetic peptidoglycan transglycosylase